MIDEPHSSLDARLMAMARRLMATAPVPADRLDWETDSLFRAMQTYAAIKNDHPEADILAGCETLGDAKINLYAEKYAST